jgi:hypothetical protein
MLERLEVTLRLQNSVKNCVRKAEDSRNTGKGY